MLTLRPTKANHCRHDILAVISKLFPGIDQENDGPTN